MSGRGSGTAADAVPLLAVVGSINVDVTVRLERFPVAGETLLADERRRAPGGKGGNQAAAASQLGDGHVILVGAVGDDPDGVWVRERLEEAGVRTADVKTVTDAPTGVAFVSVDAHGENTIVVSPGANGRAFPVAAQLPAARGYLFSLEIPLEAVLRAVEAADGLVVVNASPACALPPALIDRVDVFIVNETEFALMPELTGAREVIETRGADGVRIHRRGELVTELPAVPVERVVSTVGAGDAFCAAVVVGLLSGMSTARAARAATHVGAFAVMQPDAQPALSLLGEYTPGDASA